MKLVLRTLLLLALAALLPAQQSAVPGKEWERWPNPEAAGYSSKRLEAVRGWLQSLPTTAMMVAVDGKSLFEYGDLSHLSYLASVRKSILAMLYGNYVERGVIDLDKTLKEIGLNDIQGLQSRELEATVEHLISARSGVYHPASNPGDNTDSAPPRNSQRPGAYYLYNNWDFNAAGAAFENLTGIDIHDAVEKDLARPIGMQDFDRSKQQKSGDPKRSQHMAYHMWLSTRDMARIGLLMQREGDWGGKQVIPRAWARRIISLVTPFADMNPPSLRSTGQPSRWGYGYMWWVWDAPANASGAFRGAYTGMGAIGQYITVLPQLNMVIAHKTDPAGRRAVNSLDYMATLHMLIASRCQGPCQ